MRALIALALVAASFGSVAGECTALSRCDNSCLAIQGVVWDGTRYVYCKPDAPKFLMLPSGIAIPWWRVEDIKAIGRAVWITAADEVVVIVPLRSYREAEWESNRLIAEWRKVVQK